MWPASCKILRSFNRPQLSRFANAKFVSIAKYNTAATTSSLSGTTEKPQAPQEEKKSDTVAKAEGAAPPKAETTSTVASVQPEAAKQDIPDRKMEKLVERDFGVGKMVKRPLKKKVGGKTSLEKNADDMAARFDEAMAGLNVKPDLENVSSDELLKEPGQTVLASIDKKFDAILSELKKISAALATSKPAFSTKAPVFDFPEPDNSGRPPQAFARGGGAPPFGGRPQSKFPQRPRQPPADHLEDFDDEDDMGAPTRGGGGSGGGGWKPRGGPQGNFSRGTPFSGKQRPDRRFGKPPGDDDIDDEPRGPPRGGGGGGGRQFGSGGSRFGGNRGGGGAQRPPQQ